MPKLKHYAIAIAVTGGIFAVAGAFIWTVATESKVGLIVMVAVFALGVIHFFATNYAEQEKIMKGDDQ